ncbi:cytochrome d ubiquinol oxidase subunit II [Xanthovirga aplysinae]|uniref:cytochrome d ubiquinol oxidase subunit II n=1 Tax=Xanthovirga aplysinae TaxID=2529853 RepID=UPI0012BBAFB2|nr:cytochrome d ubiquinol oxidase subunit II [Xanthovirga aplysinae]MTI30934.1 cytochrome d ubiquinol oxidase subunit II [Xanthovirga aplysinae]
MEIVWLCILAFMFVMYAILDGFDFGAGMLDLFLAKEEQESMLIKRSIGPFWDGNEVWLVASGGLLFMAFPKLYAAFFSGFYLPLMMVLWLIMGRGISLELRNQVDNSLWKALWDKLFGLSSLLLALIFGIAFGNVLRGVNLGGVENGVSLYESNFFFAPLWTDFVNPENPGVIDWFSLFIGLITVFTLMIHGGNWVILKIEGQFKTKIKRFIRKITVIVFLMMLLSFYFVHLVKPDIYSNFLENKFLLLLPLIGIIALLLNVIFQRAEKELAAFLCSSIFIAGMFTSALAGIFPSLLPSTNSINPDLTIYNVSASDYGLGVGLKWWIIGIILILAYSFMVHWMYRGKIANDKEIYKQYH